MIYMSRLGIWGEGTPFRTFDDFLHAIEKRFVLLTSTVFSESVLIFWINIRKWLCSLAKYLSISLRWCHS